MSGTATAENTLHAQLREATRAPHRMLDHHPLLAPLVRPDLSIRQYGDALLGLHGVHAPLEARIAEYLAGQPDLFDHGPRRKTPVIEADIATLGRRPGPVMMVTDPLLGIHDLVGTLYVLEGSMLGGRVIARQLQQSGMGKLPSRFLTCYGEQVEAHWQSFLAWAEATCPAEQHASAVKTARMLFFEIAHHLDQVQDHLAPGTTAH